MFAQYPRIRSPASRMFERITWSLYEDALEQPASSSGEWDTVALCRITGRSQNFPGYLDGALSSHHRLHHVAGSITRFYSVPSNGPVLTSWGIIPGTRGLEFSRTPCLQSFHGPCHS